MDELAAPYPEDSRGSASGLGSERSLIGRPAKPEADKQRSKSWRCTLEAPSEAQQSRIRAAGMDRCTSKLHTADCLVRSLPACPRRRRPVIGARVHRRWRRASSYWTSDGAAPAGPPNTRPTDSSSNLCWALMRLVVQQSPELKLGRRPTPYCSRTTKMTCSLRPRAPVPWADGKGEMIDGRGGSRGGAAFRPPPGSRPARLRHLPEPVLPCL